jgi:hypothetical protein
MQPVTGSTGVTLVTVKKTAGKIMSWSFFNGSAAIAYAQLFDALPGTVVLGQTKPTLSIAIASGQAATLPPGHYGFDFFKGIQLAVATTRTGNGAPSATIDYNFALDLP